MRKLLKIITFLSAVIITFTCTAFLLCNLRPADIRDRADELEKYCVSNGYNTDYGILVDFGRCSLQKRLYVYDFKNDRIVMKSLAGHGSGGESTMLKADFSNAPGSHCSSLGHYKVGRHRHMYNRPAVPAVELAGLDQTNSNAMSRGILIHPSAFSGVQKADDI